MKVPEQGGQQYTEERAGHNKKGAAGIHALRRGAWRPGLVVQGAKITLLV